MASQGLDKAVQDDWALGAVRSVARHLIPPNGVYSIENGLLDDDGSIYRRGGSQYKSNAAFGASLRWVWDGILPAGQRTVFASPAAFGVLAADDVTPVSLGGAGLAAPVRAVVVGGLLFIPPGIVYGGSRKAADYPTGTVSVTKGSKVVTGAGTLWVANVDAGMLFQVGAGTRVYPVASVDSNTQVTLVDAYEGATAAGAGYALTRLAQAGAGQTPYPTAQIYATVADRLLVAAGSRIAFSNARSVLGALQPHVFDATDYHELPEGANVLGIEGVRDQAIVFSTDGVWAINNMAFDLTDAAGNPQQTLQRVSQDVFLWAACGVAAYANALVVPAVDGVYLIDGVGSPVAVAGSIWPLITSYVRSGFLPGGGVVFKNHYFLPVLDATNTVVDLLVCRLDRPVKVRNRVFYPWSWFRGHAMTVAALTTRVGTVGTARQPQLLAAGRGTDARVVNLTNVFAPAAAVKQDADGTTHRWSVETRDFETGAGETLNTVRRVKVRYELVDAAADNPLIRGYYSVGSPIAGQTIWGAFNWGSATWSDPTLGEYSLMPGVAAEDTGRDTFTWFLQARTRYLRVRLESTDPSASLNLRTLQLYIRSSGKDR